MIEKNVFIIVWMRLQRRKRCIVLKYIFQEPSANDRLEICSWFVVNYLID